MKLRGKMKEKQDDNSKVYREYINEYNRNWMKNHRKNNSKPKKRDKKINFVDEEIIKKKAEEKKEYMKNYHKDYIQKPIIKKKIREYSRDYMGSLRNNKYKKEISDCFPKEELLNNINGEEIEEGELKRDIFNILSEKEELSIGKRRKVLYCPLWTNALDEFMLGREYIKEGNKYIPIQK